MLKHVLNCGQRLGSFLACNSTSVLSSGVKRQVILLCKCEQICGFQERISTNNPNEVRRGGRALERWSVKKKEQKVTWGQRGGRRSWTDAERERVKQLLQLYHPIFHPHAVRPQVLICFSAEFSKETTGVGGLQPSKHINWLPWR